MNPPALPHAAAQTVAPPLPTGTGQSDFQARSQPDLKARSQPDLQARSQRAGLRPRRRVWPWIVGLLLVSVLIGVAWAIWRQPDTRALTPQQLAAFDQKLAQVERAGGVPPSAPDAAVVPVDPSTEPGTLEKANQPQDETQPYQPGDKSLVFTEREINHLLRERLQLGDKVRVALRDGKIAVYADIPIEQGAPLLGGQTLRLRSQVLAGEQNGHPVLQLDDLTLWGISLPNAWLGELKGRNLLASGGVEVSPENSLARGITRLQVRSGRIEVQLAD